MTHKVRILRSRNPLRDSRRFLSGIDGLLNLFFIGPMKKSRQEELQDAKVQKLLQDRKIGEITNGIKHNQLVLLDIKIEQEKLKLRELQNRVGDPDKFAPPLDTP